MPEPVDGHFTCIGCGASIPMGSDICPGCRHRFAGPEPSSTPGHQGATSVLPPFPRPSRPDALAVFGYVVAVLAIGCATLFASAIAFVVTCSVASSGFDHLELGLGLGTLMALLIAAGGLLLVVRVFPHEQKVNR